MATQRVIASGLICPHCHTRTIRISDPVPDCDCGYLRLIDPLTRLLCSELKVRKFVAEIEWND